MEALSPFDAAAALIVLATVLGCINHRFVGLPHTIGLTIMGAAASLMVVSLDFFLPGGGFRHALHDYLQQIDFYSVVINGLLSFLLFAGALHIDIGDLRENKLAVTALSTAAVLISAVTVGLGLKLITWIIGINISSAWCLVFGALISPTDPVAVMGILRSARVPASIEATVAGESLFNDGVGIVLFTVLLAVATGESSLSLPGAVQLFAVEAFGGAALGIALGWVGVMAMRRVAEYNLAALISLAIVMGGHALASKLHVSGPVAMAAAGLLIGNHGIRSGVTEQVRDHLQKFWSLTDEILNSVLFLLIGLQVVAVAARWDIIVTGILAIPMVLAARAGSISLPLAWMAALSKSVRGAFPILLWGGLRGGVSIALALSLPNGAEKDVILATTYIVVIFSVIIQGSTVGAVAKRVSGGDMAIRHG